MVMFGLVQLQFSGFAVASVLADDEDDVVDEPSVLPLLSVLPVLSELVVVDICAGFDGSVLPSGGWAVVEGGRALEDGRVDGDSLDGGLGSISFCPGSHVATRWM